MAGPTTAASTGPRKTYTVAELADLNTQARLAGRPEPIQLLRGAAKHRYCWAVGANAGQRRQHRRALEQRMARYQFVPADQPRLLSRWQRWLAALFVGGSDAGAPLHVQCPY